MENHQGLKLVAVKMERAHAEHNGNAEYPHLIQTNSTLFTWPKKKKRREREESKFPTVPVTALPSPY